MQEKHLYEYAIIRVVPKVEREEFINVGLIVFCKRKKYLKVKIDFNSSKWKAFSSELDTDQLLHNLTSFERIVSGDKSAGPIAQFEVAERFRWLTAVRSSCIQTSRPHAGLTDDVEVLFDDLFSKLVI